MAARSIASLTISFGLVSIPVKLYSATESSAAVHFKWMAPGGARVRQQYVAEPPAPPAVIAPAARRGPEPREEPATSPAVALPRQAAARPVAPTIEAPAPAVIERSDLVKGYEFERGRFVLFTPDELKALAEGTRKTIDIVAFVPERSVDPIYYDKSYYLTPDKRGGKPYTLLLRAMQRSGRCALAKWAWRSKEYVVQIRPADGGLVLQQLFYADEVRNPSEFRIELEEVSDAEVQLAVQLIEQIAQDVYDPAQFVDEEKRRILAAVEQKIAGRKVVAPPEAGAQPGSNVVDLMEALRASLRSTPSAQRAQDEEQRARRPARRASATTTSAAKTTAARSRK